MKSAFYLTLIAALLLGVFLVFVVNPARAETVKLQIKVEHCNSLADSLKNIATWRKAGMSQADGVKAYDETLPALYTLSPYDVVVVRIVHDQIRQVYAIPEKKFEKLTPEMLAVDALKLCHKNAGEIEIK